MNIIYGILLKIFDCKDLLLYSLIIFFGYQVSNLKFDYDFEKFFPAEDVDADFFYEHREKFEFDNNFVLVGIENTQGVFQKDFLLRLDSLTKSFQQNLPYLAGVRSITNQEEVFFYQGGASSKKPYVNFYNFSEPHQQDSSLRADSIRVFNSKELVNTLISSDSKSVCVFIKHENDLSREKSDDLVSELRSVLAEFNFDSIHLAGTAVGQQYYIQKMNKEMLLYMG